MRHAAVIVDIDNTLVDTAVRKQAILCSEFSLEVSVDVVRSDYHLHSVLGDRSTEASVRFERVIDSEKGVVDFDAPLFDGALTAVKYFRDQGIKVVMVTGRPADLRSVTVQELQSHGLTIAEDELHFANPIAEAAQSNGKTWTKIPIVGCLCERLDVLAVVGDRPEDVEAAFAHSVPAVIFGTTLPREESQALVDRSTAGAVVASSWIEVVRAVEAFKSGSEEIQRLREEFTNQYSMWLGDIDRKTQISASIAGVVAALAGTVITTSDELLGRDWILLGVLTFALLSLLYAIRAYTSRHTSGPLSGTAVSTVLKQHFAILFGRPSRWAFVKNDAIDQYRALRNATELTKSRLHMSSFFSRYGTTDAQALKNLRLMELRASNYAKLYAERAASWLLTLALVFFFAWVTWGLLETLSQVAQR